MFFSEEAKIKEKEKRSIFRRGRFCFTIKNRKDRYQKIPRSVQL